MINRFLLLWILGLGFVVNSMQERRVARRPAQTAVGSFVIWVGNHAKNYLVQKACTCAFLYCFCDKDLSQIVTESTEYKVVSNCPRVTYVVGSAVATAVPCSTHCCCMVTPAAVACCAMGVGCYNYYRSSHMDYRRED